MQDGVDCRELGNDSFERRDHDHLERQALHRLVGLGYEVTLTPKNPAA